MIQHNKNTFPCRCTFKLEIWWSGFFNSIVLEKSGSLDVKHLYEPCDMMLRNCYPDWKKWHRHCSSLASLSIMVSQLGALPKLLNTIVLWGYEGFQGLPMMPRNASLLENDKSDRWYFSGLFCSLILVSIFVHNLVWK